MNGLDLLLLALLLAAVAWAVVHLLRSGARCGGCRGDCAHCSSRAGGRKPPDPSQP